MSALSRRKGARAELELFRLLSDELGFVVRRNVDQARAGGADGIEIPGWAVEVKRREALAVPSWWRQACRQAHFDARMPVLFFRRSKEPWKAVLPGSAIGAGEWAPRRATFSEAVMELRESIASRGLAIPDQSMPEELRP